MSNHIYLVIKTFLGNPESYEGVDDDELIGGAEINLYRTAQLLLDEGYEVTVVQRDNGNDRDEYDGIDIEYVDVPLLSGRAQQLAFNVQWQRHVPDDCIVHAQSLDYVIPLIARVDSVNQQGLTWDTPHGEGLSTKIKRRYIKRMLASGSYVRASDNSFLTYVQSEHTSYREQVFPIPNGVDVERFAPATGVQKPTGMDASGGCTILFPRTIRVARGAHLFVDAILKLQGEGYNVKGYFLGAKNTEDYRRVRTQLDRSPRGDAIEFLGHVPHEEMPRYYNAADIVTIPTYHSEGSSIACIEAMACGKPIVVTDVGGLKELVYQNHADGGLKVKPTVEALARGIEQLVSDPELRDELGENARERAERYYRKERWERQMREYFSRVVRERGGE